MDVSGIRIRVGTADDWQAISDLLSVAFHHTGDEEGRAQGATVFEPERSLVAEEAGETLGAGEAGLVVGHTGAYSRELSVPGGVTPAAFVTLVGVRPTHRRRGLLTAMMRRQLADVAASGEPIAVLWASEGRIYPRFGYGMAVQRLSLTAETREIAVSETPASDGRLRWATPSAVVADMSKVYEQLRPDRPGFASRDDRWWRHLTADLKSERDGATALHAVIHDTPGGPTGYALWRTKGHWTETGPNGDVQVQEVVAADPAAYAALWRMLLTIDLARTMSWGFATPDDPLIHLVNEPDRLGARGMDSLWVRLVDLPRALETRRYAVRVDTVLDVTDPLFEANSGRWRLTGDPGGASCRRTGDPADVSLGVLELGAAYLGGTSLTALAGAGRVREHRPGALTAASLAFGWHRQPAGIEVF